MNKRAQFELIGLAIVVMLVVLGMFIVIRLQMFRQPTTVQTTYSQTQLASNFLNTLLLTNTDCGDRLVRELLIDCADLRAIRCNGETSCQRAETILDQILSQTLDKWNKRYLITMKKAGSQIVGMNEKRKDCIPGEMDTEMPGIYYYNLEAGGTLTIRLDLCY
jgi:hypothetical protein